MPIVTNDDFVIALRNWLKYHSQNVDFNAEVRKQEPYVRWRKFIGYPLDAEWHCKDFNAHDVPQHCADVVRMLMSPHYATLIKAKLIRDADASCSNR